MPVIFTKPPSGIQPIPYSVSPRWKRSGVRPKNSEKRSTRMPTALAAAKWPELVQDDQRREAREGEDPAHCVMASWATSSPAIRRASASAS